MTGFCNRVLGMHHQLPSRLLLSGKFGTKRNGGGLYIWYPLLYNSNIKEGK